MSSGVPLSAEASARAKKRWAVIRNAFLSNSGTKAVTAFLELGQKRVKALEAIANGQVQINADASAVPLTSQGDLSMYTMEALNARRKIARMPVVTRWLREHWKLVTGKEHPEGSDIILKDDYTRFFLECARSLMPAMDTGTKFSISADDIAEEWDKDSGGRGVMDFPAFCTALFELVDQWTSSISVDEYVWLLTSLHAQVSVAAAKWNSSGVGATGTVDSDAGGEPLKRSNSGSGGSKVALNVKLPDVTASGASATPRSVKGLPQHSCHKQVDGYGLRHAMDGGHCMACRRISEWEAARRRILQRLSETGTVPWIGAYYVRPDTYSALPRDSNLSTFVPVEDPLVAFLSPTWRSPGGGSILARASGSMLDSASVRAAWGDSNRNRSSSGEGDIDDQLHAHPWKVGLANWEQLTSRLGSVPKPDVTIDPASLHPVFDPTLPHVTLSQHGSRPVTALASDPLHLHSYAGHAIGTGNRIATAPDAIVDLNLQMDTAIRVQRKAQRLGQTVSLRSVGSESTLVPTAKQHRRSHSSARLGGNASGTAAAGVGMNNISSASLLAGGSMQQQAGLVFEEGDDVSTLIQKIHSETGLATHPSNIFSQAGTSLSAWESTDVTGPSNPSSQPATARSWAVAGNFADRVARTASLSSSALTHGKPQDGAARGAVTSWPGSPKASGTTVGTLLKRPQSGGSVRSPGGRLGTLAPGNLDTSVGIPSDALLSPQHGLVMSPVIGSRSGGVVSGKLRLHTGDTSPPLIPSASPPLSDPKMLIKSLSPTEGAVSQFSPPATRPTTAHFLPVKSGSPGTVASPIRKSVLSASMRKSVASSGVSQSAGNSPRSSLPPLTTAHAPEKQHHSSSGKLAKGRPSLGAAATTTFKPRPATAGATPPQLVVGGPALPKKNALFS